jgi:hypothetical protein
MPYIVRTCLAPRRRPVARSAFRHHLDNLNLNRPLGRILRRCAVCRILMKNTEEVLTAASLAAQEIS